MLEIWIDLLSSRIEKDCLGKLKWVLTFLIEIVNHLIGDHEASFLLPIVFIPFLHFTRHHENFLLSSFYMYIKMLSISRISTYGWRIDLLFQCQLCTQAHQDVIIPYFINWDFSKSNSKYNYRVIIITIVISYLLSH